MSHAGHSQEDPYLWLEEIDSERALGFARQNNAVTLDYLQSQPVFEALYNQNLEILNASARIPSPSLRGDYIYNFWRDAEHVRGIWRRTGIAEYRESDPDWETVLDLDTLAAREGENWVWSGASCRYPDYDRCLIALSRGGADAVVVREFDLESLEFVADGFGLAEAKSDIYWRDRDSVFVGTDFGSNSLTDSGYPRIVKLWHRGTPLDDAETVFTGEPADVSSRAYRIWDGNEFVDIVQQSTSFYSSVSFVYDPLGLIRLDVPEDADIVGLKAGQLLLWLKSDWDVDGRQLPQGALVAANLAALEAGEAQVSLLFEPSARVALTEVHTTLSAIVLGLVDNVTSRVEIMLRSGDEWRRQPVAAPAGGSIEIVSTDPASDRFLFSFEGFLTPPTLYEADATTRVSASMKRQPAFFDASGMRVEQLAARSADGTEIPYFVVTPDGFEPDGRNPTLLYGYGGFEISLTPSYSATTGTAWLERGGVYVVANIRGGGEFGPAWHQAALLENRQRAFDDFIAVAEDLIARDITAPEYLGISGGSNGGLLVGAVFVQRPDLFNAVVCQVPLLDMRRYHRLLAGASWMAEFGDPDDPDDWDFIGRYSPYQNVEADADYPQIYFFTSTRDDRVHPGHARKMVARMQAQGHDVLYYENIEGGHGGAANLSQSALNQALTYAYLHARLQAALQ